ncbi:MAG: cyclase family protein [Flavobacteriales bacterium]|nr:cyclase family protein [Flavobacteriales bacterium]
MRLYLNFSDFIDTNKPIDVSIPIRSENEYVRAWYVDPPKFEIVRANGFIGSVAEGGSTNFRDVIFNPHGHGTHTECLGHISTEVYSINQHLKSYFWKASLVSVIPDNLVNGDTIIKRKHLENQINSAFSEAVLIRTMPNDELKMSKDYSNSNPTYFDLDIIPLLDQLGTKHFLVDLPSVDREEDEGELAFHHAFWNLTENPDYTRTITELIYVPNSVVDGEYLLELQVAAFENDASPSRPVLYRIEK